MTSADCGCPRQRLFHFSDDPAIGRFEPRPVRRPSARPDGWDWLNGPLVWAIDEAHAPLYLFPRDCPRILVWPTSSTTGADRRRWFGAQGPRAIAHVERAWLGRIRAATLHRYDMPRATFEDIGDVGMWVSRETVTPLATEALTDLPGWLDAMGVELRALDSLTGLRDVWSTSLHASGLRLRNAAGWV